MERTGRRSRVAAEAEHNPEENRTLFCHPRIAAPADGRIVKMCEQEIAFKRAQSR